MYEHSQISNGILKAHNKKLCNCTVGHKSVPATAQNYYHLRMRSKWVSKFSLFFFSPQYFLNFIMYSLPSQDHLYGKLELFRQKAKWWIKCRWLALLFPGTQASRLGGLLRSTHRKGKSSQKLHAAVGALSTASDICPGKDVRQQLQFLYPYCPTQGHYLPLHAENCSQWICIQHTRRSRHHCEGTKGCFVPLHKSDQSLWEIFNKNFISKSSG